MSRSRAARFTRAALFRISGRKASRMQEKSSRPSHHHLRLEDSLRPIQVERRMRTRSPNRKFLLDTFETKFEHGGTYVRSTLCSGGAKSSGVTPTANWVSTEHKDDME
jgi:hypothetical protein